MKKCIALLAAVFALWSANAQLATKWPSDKEKFLKSLDSYLAQVKREDVTEANSEFQKLIKEGKITAEMILPMIPVCNSMGERLLPAAPYYVDYMKAIMAATIGIMLTYAIGWIGSMFGANLRFWDNAGPVGIVISLVIVGVAAFNLLLDFDFIERGANGRLPKNYQWVGALGLLVTLVWLYLEMLRLISKLRD